MRLSLEDGGAILCAESSAEAAFLAGNGLKQKLAYTVGSGGQWQIKKKPRTFSVKYAEKEVLLPDNLSEGALGYALRIVVDGLALDRGWIPFHAAGVTGGRLQVLLFAGSGEGKSHFSQYLCSHLDAFRRYGDDHLILSGSMIRGNQSCRQRSGDGQESIASDHVVCSKGTSRIGLCLRPGPGAGSITAIPSGEALQRLEDASALKYLLDHLAFNGVEYDLNQVFQKDKLEQYRQAVIRSVADLRVLYQINGPFPYMENTMLQMVKEQYQ